MLEVPVYIKKFFEFWGYAKEGYSIISRAPKLKAGVKSYENIDELSYDFFNEKISDGNQIEVSGFLSTYQHCFKPYTQNSLVLDFIKGPLKIDVKNPPSWDITNTFSEPIYIKKNDGFRYNPKYMGVEGLTNIKGNIKPPLLSATRIPSIQLDSSNLVYPVYLYPSNSKGLNGSIIDDENYEYIIPDTSLGIPMIVNNQQFIQQYQETHVQVYGVIKEIPNDIILSLSNFPNSVKDEIAKMYYKPFKLHNKGYCILVNEIENVENTLYNNDRNMRLYIEGHFESQTHDCQGIIGLYKDMDYIMQIFKANFDGQIYNSRTNNLISLTLGNIFVSFRNPSFMGIYIDVPSYLQYEECVSNLFMVFEKVVKVMKLYFLKEYKTSLEFTVDAIFDYHYHDRFDNAKFMNSKSIEGVVSNETRCLILNWLTQK